MSNEKSKLILVDDHPLLRKGVRQLVELEEDMEVVGEASNGADAIVLVQEIEADLVLLDLTMKGMDGIETLQGMRDVGISCRIVVFTVSDDTADVIAALKAGADGYLLKDMEPEKLVTRIREACSGKLVLSEELAEILAKSFRDDTAKGRGDGYNSLTRREKEILKMIAEGLSNKMIGRQLNIVEATVKVHVKHLLKKLGLRSRVEAAVWAVENRVK
ncbi:MAG: two-component system response regulator NarL [Porticoccus sp.]|nr:two-component system response regulator NarL [Porticoccus sp.]PCJ91640.1 MAG: two-component system response regulator NarL [Porticoccaceae bacterium]